jgi:hypothetical protein
MPKSKDEPKVKEEKPTMYKGYDMKWLKEQGTVHEDFYLVAEYEAKFGEVGKK